MPAEKANTSGASSPKKRVRLWNLFNSILLWANYLIALALGLSYLSPYISPANFWGVAFLGLAYPFLLVGNIVFLVYWLILWKRRSMISLFVILIGYAQLSTFVQWNLNTSTENASDSTVKVMSYNVRLFDLYNWTNNKATRNKIFEFLVSEQNDILCLQEVYVDATKDFKTLDSLVKVQKATNLHFELTAVVDETHKFGIATLTKFPIVSKGVIEFSPTSHNICIYTDVLIHADTVRIYNAHLQSVRFGSEDYKYLEGLLAESKEKVEYEKSKTILRRLKNAFIKRAKQAEMIKAHMLSSPYPYVLCGDFNDTPASYTYNTLCEGVTDAFLNSGYGIGQTYIGKLPSFRIDYILHSNDLKSSEFLTIPVELSDHYPITCFINKD